MPSHTHKKFVRSNETAGLLRIESRDAALLQDVADYRFLNTPQIAALHNRGLRNFQRRLHDLYHAGYLDRPPQQNISALAKRHIIYSLGEKGVEFLYADDKERGERLRQVKLNRETSFPYIAHALMISQFRATLTLALREHPTHPSIQKWMQGYELKDALTLRGQSPELVPDAFFTIKEGSDAIDFCLEADRSTMDLKRFANKLKIYWKWRDGKYKEQLDASHFRVLTITVSEKRKENLLRTAKNTDTRKEGSNMFLFACEKDYSLTNPDTILQNIWLSAKDGAKPCSLVSNYQII